jgi:galactonate dehydratase
MADPDWPITGSTGGGQVLQLRCRSVPDPDGHDPSLLLKGDWIVVEISDGRARGRGEASHSGNDAECIKTVRRLFSKHIRRMDPTMHAIQELELGPFASTASFVQATAVSALNQALYELVAKQHGVPVWKLFADEVARERIAAYATLNRAVRGRTREDYEDAVRHALSQGFRAVKCAPFEGVTKHGSQLDQSRHGLSVLRHLRDRFPELSLRVDFHERFQLAAFLAILPELEPLSLHWLEAPIPLGEGYRELRQVCHTKVALGELRFGVEGFRDIVEQRWADVVMPDVKHVGGVGPLIRLARYCEGQTGVSPHNPSGPIATLASAHVCAAQHNVGALELPLITNPGRAYYSDWLSDGFLRLPCGSGWGSEAEIP